MTSSIFTKTIRDAVVRDYETGGFTSAKNLKQSPRKSVQYWEYDAEEYEVSYPFFGLEAGRYEIWVYVPHRLKPYNTSLVYVDRNYRRQYVYIDVTHVHDNWLSLGVHDIRDNPTIFLQSYMDHHDNSISVASSVRLERYVQPPIGAANKFGPPVRSFTQPDDLSIWPQNWLDATGYANSEYPQYLTQFGAYHTGSDLNLPRDADRGAPLFSLADNGLVTYAKWNSSWGGLVVIKYPYIDEIGEQKYCYARYAHMPKSSISVRVGDTVSFGQKIAVVGDFDGNFAAHLHFDISLTTILETSPGHWPGTNKVSLYEHYVDPKLFLQEVNKWPLQK